MQALDIFLTFLRLGLTSFGGPVAHLGYFRADIVEKRRWLDESAYAELVAICQFLPGPASSQVGFGIGLLRGGLPGALAAFLGFTLPSALALGAFALGLANLTDVAGSGWLQGLKIVALAVVALAVWQMARSLCPDAPRIGMALLAAAALLVLPGSLAQIGVILVGGLVGLVLLRGETPDSAGLHVPVSRTFGIVCLILFSLLLAGLPLLAHLGSGWGTADLFYRAGSLVFGGGHVVLPLLQAEMVPGLVDNDSFLAGYGAAQAVPGPLFTFASFLGVAGETGMHPAAGWALATLMIFLPGFLLLLGILPFWTQLAARPGARAALMGVNAAVVGLLLAALYDPVFTSAVSDATDLALALIALLALAVVKLPPWALVLGAALIGWGIPELLTQL